MKTKIRRVRKNSWQENDERILLTFERPTSLYTTREREARPTKRWLKYICRELFAWTISFPLYRQLSRVTRRAARASRPRVCRIINANFLIRISVGAKRYQRESVHAEVAVRRNEKNER